MIPPLGDMCLKSIEGGKQMIWMTDYLEELSKKPPKKIFLYK